MSEHYPEHLDPTLFALFRREFELCNVQPNERVLIVHDSATRPDYVAISAGVLQSLGASAFTLQLPGIARSDLALGADSHQQQAAHVDTASIGSTQDIQSPASELLAAVAPAVSMVIDLQRLHHGLGFNEILQAGARILSFAERPDVLERLFSAPDLKQRVQRGVALLDATSEMRITSPAGTNLTADISGAVGRGQYGYADRPGRQAAWPGGYVAAFPRQGGTSGTIVLSVGDMLFHFNKYVETPVYVTVERSYITAIEGDGLDARLLREYLGSWRDPESFATSHIGWGLNDNARWHALQFYDKDTTQGQDGRGLYGGFMWSTGPNPYAKRFVPGHLDLPMLGCTITLDGRPVVVDGNIVDDQMKPTAQRSSAAAAAAGVAD
jgi:2,5-dihydroxypyridine 5,6-dioxygenase